MTTKTALPVQQRTLNRVRGRDYILPACVALACAGAAFAGADTTFDPALTKFTDFLEGSGGKIITVLSLAGGLIGLASGRFSLGQVAVPVGVGIGVGCAVGWGDGASWQLTESMKSPPSVFRSPSTASQKEPID